MASLQIHLNEIPEEGALALVCDVQRGDLGLSEGDPQLKDVFQVKGELRDSQRGVLAVGTMSGTVVEECVRCLEAFDTEVTVPFSGFYSTSHLGEKGKPGLAKDDDLSTDLEDDEPYVVVDNLVDLKDMLREHLILGHSSHPLCRPACKGLCQRCGQNLNRALCACGETELQSPFSILRNLKDTRR